jgi:molybdate transport system substrate-binding protein
MKIRSFLVAAKIGFLMLLAQGVEANAAEVKVIAGAAIRPVMAELGPRFERATGHKLVIQYGIAGTIKPQIEAGEGFDLFLLSPATIGDLIKEGKIAPGAHKEIARVGMGVGARRGAPKPDIGSVDAFKRALLNAKSITYAPEGATGKHLTSVFQRLEIAEQMKAKTKTQKGPELAAQAVADGDADLGFAPINILVAVREVELVGPFPKELQNYIVFTAGLSTDAKEPEAAKALIQFLTTPAAVAVIKAKGLEPGTP